MAVDDDVVKFVKRSTRRRICSFQNSVQKVAFYCMLFFLTSTRSFSTISHTKPSKTSSAANEQLSLRPWSPIEELLQSCRRSAAEEMPAGVSIASHKTCIQNLIPRISVFVERYPSDSSVIGLEAKFPHRTRGRVRLGCDVAVLLVTNRSRPPNRTQPKSSASHRGYPSDN